MSGFKMNRPQVDTHRTTGIQPRTPGLAQQGAAHPFVQESSILCFSEVAMVLGMTLATYTLIHVIISLVAIASGLIVFIGMSANKRMDALTALFLSTTVLTSVTGFFFPFSHVTPGIIL